MWNGNIQGLYRKDKLTVKNFLQYIKTFSAIKPSYINNYRWNGMLLWFKTRFHQKDWIEDDT